MINRKFKKIFTEDVFQKIIEDIIKADLKKNWLPEHEEDQAISRQQWKKFLKKTDLYYSSLKTKIFSRALFGNTLKPNQILDFAKYVHENIDTIKKVHIKEAKKFKRKHNFRTVLTEIADVFGGTGLVLLGSLLLSTTIVSIVLDIIIIATH